MSVCSNCWREFPSDDWQMPYHGGECYACRTATVTPEQRHQGFVNGMRQVDSATLRRWVASTYASQVRKDVATMILRERHGHPA